MPLNEGSVRAFLITFSESINCHINLSLNSTAQHKKVGILLVTNISSFNKNECIILCHLKLFHFCFTVSAPQLGCVDMDIDMAVLHIIIIIT